jgi:hypothetical protein
VVEEFVDVVVELEVAPDVTVPLFVVPLVVVGDVVEEVVPAVFEPPVPSAPYSPFLAPFPQEAPEMRTGSSDPRR